MSTVSQSPRPVTLAALEVGTEALPAYGHRFSPRGFSRELSLRTIIPVTIGRPTDKAPTGYYRRLMSRRLHLMSYGRRWQAETAISIIKRRLGSAVNARSYWSQCRALMLKAVAHNIFILYVPTARLRRAA